MSSDEFYTTESDSAFEGGDPECTVLISQGGLPYISLSNRRLRCLESGWFQQCSNICYLYLNGNYLESIPDDLFNVLTNLQWLDLRDNGIKVIPRNIINLESLNGLLLQNNCIQCLPVELGGLKHLKQLSYSGNPLCFPHDSILEKGAPEVLSYLKFCWEHREDPDFEDFMKKSVILYEKMLDERKQKKPIKPKVENKINLSEVKEQMGMLSDSLQMVDRITVEKLQEILDEQYKKIQASKSREALSQWRDKYMIHNYATKPLDPVPFGTHKRYNKMLNRRDLAKPIKEEKIVHSATNEISVDEQLREIGLVLDKLRSSKIRSSDPKMDMKYRMEEINALKAVEKKLNKMRGMML